MNNLTLDQVTHVFARHAPLYRKRPARYQTVMLNDLAAIWSRPHNTLLDVGGGTGIMATAIKQLFDVREVHAIDVVDRYFPDLPVGTHVYDGQTMPFANDHFEATTINNVMHHVPLTVRATLMREIRRVTTGPLYIKDHIAHGPLDPFRLFLLDAIGNIPFGGMIKANYLSRADWTALADAAGYTIGAWRQGIYREGPIAAFFPNDLEICMRFDPV